MPDFSDTERRLIDLLEVGVIIFLPKKTPVKKYLGL